MKRWMAMVVLAGLLIGACGGGKLPTYGSFSSITDELSKNNIDCTDPSSNDAPDSEAPAGATETGFCSYGSTYVDVTIFKAHSDVTKYINNRGGLVYGDDWVIQPDDTKDNARIAKALKGKISTRDGGSNPESCDRLGRHDDEQRSYCPSQ